MAFIKEIDESCSITKMYGDKIILKNDLDKLNGLLNSNISIYLNSFIKMYFGRDIDIDHSSIDILECTELEPEDIKAKM